MALSDEVTRQGGVGEKTQVEMMCSVGDGHCKNILGKKEVTDIEDQVNRHFIN